MVSQDWQARAACRDEDPELFAPASYEGPGAVQAAAAKVVCWRCPVVSECLADAISQGDRDTVRGGLTPEERRGMGTPPPPPERVMVVRGKRQRPEITDNLRVQVLDLIGDGIPVADVGRLVGIGEHWARVIVQEAVAA